MNSGKNCSTCTFWQVVEATASATVGVGICQQMSGGLTLPDAEGIDRPLATRGDFCCSMWLGDVQP